MHILELNIIYIAIEAHSISALTEKFLSIRFLM